MLFRLFHHLIFSDCFMKIFVSQKKNNLAMLIRNATTFQYCKSRLASILEFLCIFGNKAQCLSPSPVCLINGTFFPYCPSPQMSLNRPRPLGATIARLFGETAAIMEQTLQNLIVSFE